MPLAPRSHHHLASGHKCQGIKCSCVTNSLNNEVEMFLSLHAKILRPIVQVVSSFSDKYLRISRELPWLEICMTIESLKYY